MKMSYQPLEGGERKSITIKVTTDHSASSYGQPVLVMPDGQLLNLESWVLLDYRIERITAAELELLRRSPLTWDSSPVASQIAAATPAAGRPETSNPRRRRNLSLTAAEMEQLSEIGDGNASQGVSRLLADWRQSMAHSAHAGSA